MPENDWLDDCVPWDGREADLPTGANMPPKVDVLKLIKSWKVLDGESEEGFIEKRRAELLPEDVLIGAVPNKNSIRIILKTYGSRAFEFISAGGKKMGPEQWAATYGTNPFEVLAVVRMNAGGGHPVFNIADSRR